MRDQAKQAADDERDRMMNEIDRLRADQRRLWAIIRSLRGERRGKEHQR